MLNLASVSSLPIQFDTSSSQFKYQSEIKCRRHRTVRLHKLLPALLNKSLRYPENVYNENIDMYFCEDTNLFHDNRLHYEILVLPSGLLGIEFIKSHIYYTPTSQGKTSSVIECLYGILTIIIQKNAPKDELDFETAVDEGIMIKLRKGEKIEIPSGYFYTFVNTRNTPVIFSRVFKNKGIVDYTMLQQEQGLAYFAIRKNARAEIVYNPRYKSVPKLAKYTPSDERFGFQYKKNSLYQTIKKETNYFAESLAEN